MEKSTTQLAIEYDISDPKQTIKHIKKKTFARDQEDWFGNCRMIDSVKMEINKEHIGYTKTGLRLRII